MKIFNIYDELLYEDDNENVKETIENCVRRKVNLSYANLKYAYLLKANLEYASLFNANLQKANLSHANLRFAKLQNANLRSVNLENADLSYTYLTGANLAHAHLESANLYKADLSRVNLYFTSLQNANMKKAWLSFSSLPLWRGLFDIKVSNDSIYQLLYHICMFKNNSEEFGDIKSFIVKYANKWTGIKEHSLKEIKE